MGHAHMAGPWCSSPSSDLRMTACSCALPASSKPVFHPAAFGAALDTAVLEGELVRNGRRMLPLDRR